jgi:methylenetetrahydrofolate dehydrogenase (NADP+)/methenyltetrahydrofolate cyclohydrolase
MIIIDGKKIAQDIRNELKAYIEKLKSSGKGVPGLVAILVGDNPPSEIYVRNKAKACEEIGMRAKTEKHPADMKEDDLLELIEHYNNNKEYHGILVQLPLPKHIDEDKVIEAVSPKKRC